MHSNVIGINLLYEFIRVKNVLKLFDVCFCANFRLILWTFLIVSDYFVLYVVYVKSAKYVLATWKKNKNLISSYVIRKMKSFIIPCCVYTKKLIFLAILLPILSTTTTIWLCEINHGNQFFIIRSVKWNGYRKLVLFWGR